jgi:hypothetical protein
MNSSKRETLGKSSVPRNTENSSLDAEPTPKGGAGVSHFLSGDEICKIIEVCSKRGVSQLKLGPLSLDFQAFQPTRQKPVAPGPAIPDSAPEEVTREQQAIEKLALEKEEILTREGQIAELLLTDPAEAERLMEIGDLVPAQEESDGPGAS